MDKGKLNLFFHLNPDVVSQPVLFKCSQEFIKKLEVKAPTPNTGFQRRIQNIPNI